MAEMQVRVPSPTTLMNAAFRVVGWELAVARELLMLPARVLALLDDVDEIVDRVRRLLDDVHRTVDAIDAIVASAAETVGGVQSTVVRADGVVDDVARTVATADGIVGRVNDTVDSAEGVVLRVGSTIDSAEGVVTRVGNTVDAADGLVGAAGGLIGRVEPLLDFADSALAPVKPVVEALLIDADLDPDVARLVAMRVVEILVFVDRTIETLAPLTDEVLASVEPDEVKAVVKFIDHLPALGESLERDIMPVLASMDNVAPEVHQILEVAQQCLEAVAGIPGFQLLRRRGGDNGKIPG